MNCFQTLQFLICMFKIGDYWQGDMKLNDLQKQILMLDKPDVDHRAVITKNLRLFWTKKDSNNNIIVPYVYDSTICETLFLVFLSTHINVTF